MSTRFKVVEGSQSEHCCFDATVVDTTRPVLIGDKQYLDHFEPMCECFERDDAERIAAALNAVEHGSELSAAAVAEVNRAVFDELGQPSDWAGLSKESVEKILIAADRAARGQSTTQPPAEPPGWREALQFYADRSHFMIADDDAWDTVSGEPPNLWCDEAGTATVEDGTVAAMALRGTPLPDEVDEPAPDHPDNCGSWHCSCVECIIEDLTADLPNVVATAPERLYLVIGEDCPPEEDFGTLDEVTWCADKIDENSIEYVRADRAARGGTA